MGELMSWNLEGMDPHGRTALIFRDASNCAVAGIYREKKIDRWKRAKENVWWWAKPKFSEQKVSSVTEALNAIRVYRPERVPEVLVTRLEAQE